MAEIILDRGEQANVLKLDDDEQAFLNEIEISTEKPIPKRRPPIRRKPPVKPYMPNQSENLEAFGNPTKMNAPRRQPAPEVMDHGEEFEEDMMPMDDDDEDEYENGGGMGTGSNQPSVGYTSVEDEKADLLNKLTRLEKKGLNINKKLNAYSSLEELRTEYKRIKYSVEVDQSIKFSRRMLVACVTGVEFLNKRYNPLEIQLDGWSETVMENVDDYDGVFEELYNKYKTKVNVAPEVKLIMMLGGSAMMFHLTNSMFKAAIPNMNDVMKQNPDLIKNMMSAVQNTQMAPNSQPKDPTNRPTSVDPSGRREMNGPGMDISQLMGGIMMPPPPPMNSTSIVDELPTVSEGSEDDDLSDIVSVNGESVNGEVREVKISKGRKRGGKSKKNEINL